MKKVEIKPQTNLFSPSRLLVLSFIFLFPFVAASAQNGAITGKIFDTEFNEPLIGSVVRVEGTSFMAAADFDGNFTLDNVPAGNYTLTATCVGYQPLQKTVVVESNQIANVEILMSSSEIVLGAVEVVAQANMESEVALLEEQRISLVSSQSVGARELSRKGIGDAQAAVAQVSGISRQEGVKNVFVRGLGDRYNATLLNGFPIPSEDPEYKNIALEFFSTDVIKNIGVSKVFSSSNYADVGGAIINISSKELVGRYAFGVDVSGGVNTAAVGTPNFLHQDGSNYFGFANKQQPIDNKFNFANSLEPNVVSFPMNHSYGVSGGKMWKLGEKGNPLSFFIVASHSTDYSYTKESVRNTITNGVITQDQTGEKYSQNTSQLVLANVMFDLNKKHNLQYNFMLIHANDQYVGEYKGYYDGARYADSPDETGILRRQQVNENLLLVNQLLSNWQLAKRWKFDAGVSYNSVSNSEPDRRINNFTQMPSGNYMFSSGDNQSRFYSELTDEDLNAKAALSFKLNDRVGSNNSFLKAGYNGRFTDNNFNGVRYRFFQSRDEFNLDELKIDDWHNAANQIDRRQDIAGKKFMMETGVPDSYQVTKNIHAGYVEASYQLLRKLSGNIGLRMDVVDMIVNSKIQGFSDETNFQQNFLLPSLNLKYDVTGKNSLRLGASKTYTLPQAKELSPYQYVNISFVSQGNPNLKPSENYNVDVKWDYYISTNELLSVNGFYKHILNPIGRVDEGNSAGMLTYNNISDYAMVGGVEVELRKNLFNRFNTEREQTNRLLLGLNASYIYTDLMLDISGTDPRSTQLEGASPFLANLDLTYNYTKKDKNLTAALVFNYFSNRIYTLGAMGYKDIMEEGVPTLNFTVSYKFNKHLSIKIKAGNLLNQSYRLTRETSSGEKITLNEYKKGQNISIGFSYEL